MRIKIQWGLAVACGLAVCARGRAAGHAEAVEWFDEDYAGYAETSALAWTTTAGTWTKADASDLSGYSNALQRVCVDTLDTQLTFRPKATKPVNSLVKFEFPATFTVWENSDGWLDSSIKNQYGGLGIRTTEDGEGLTFFGWHARWRHGMDNSVSEGVWLDLTAPGITPEAGHAYTVTIECDQSCLPTRIRYLIDGVPLEDSNGESWFCGRGTLRPWEAGNSKTLNGLSFKGIGEVGEIVATQAGARTARAEVTFARPGRLRTGDEISFTVTNLEGKVVGDALTYRWYREDAAGRRFEEPIAEGGATYAITEADYGHWVSVDVSDEDGYAGSGRFWCSKLPVAYIDVEPDSKGNIWPQSKSITYSAQMLLAGNATYKKQYEGDITLHVRGNSTASQDKKPYKIKLDKKTDLFGLGNGTKNKHWVLLANAYDESLMRNKVSMDLSRRFGIVAMGSEWVDVVMNGQFVGNYLLAQHIRVGEDRVNVYDWSNAAEKIAENALTANPGLTEDDQSAIEDLLETNCCWMGTGAFTYLGTNYTVLAKGTPGIGPDGSVTVVWKKFSTDISGGYIFEIDLKKVAGSESPAVCSFVQTNKTNCGTLRLHVAMNTPEYAFVGNETVSNFIWNTWQDTGLAWMSWAGCNEKGQHYRDLCDFDSMVGYWLSLYVPANTDSAAFSRYSYMDQGGKMFFGPAWDFDCGFGSLIIRTRSPAVTNEAGRVHYADIQPTGWIPGSSDLSFVCEWTADPYFTWKVREKYLEVRPYLAELVRDGGIIDGYMTNLLSSAKANDIRWASRIGFLGDSFEKGDALVMKEFLTRRLEWFDTQLPTVASAVENLAHTAYYNSLLYARNKNLLIAFDGLTQRSDSVETSMTDVRTPRRPKTLTAQVTIPSGQSAAAVRVYVNGFSNAVWQVSGGQATVEIPVAKLTKGARNLIGCDAVNASGKVVSRNVALLQCDKQGAVVFLK